jgi:hypothetical protein
MRKPSMPDAKKEWNDIFKKMDKKGLKLGKNDVVAEIKAHRKEKRKKARD